MYNLAHCMYFAKMPILSGALCIYMGYLVYQTGWAQVYILCREMPNCTPIITELPSEPKFPQMCSSLMAGHSLSSVPPQRPTKSCLRSMSRDGSSRTLLEFGAAGAAAAGAGAAGPLVLPLMLSARVQAALFHQSSLTIFSTM